MDLGTSVRDAFTKIVLSEAIFSEAQHFRVPSIEVSSAEISVTLADEGQSSFESHLREIIGRC